MAFPTKSILIIFDEVLIFVKDPNLAWRLNLHIFNKQCNYTVGWEKNKQTNKQKQNKTPAV